MQVKQIQLKMFFRKMIDSHQKKGKGHRLKCPLAHLSKNLLKKIK